MCPTTDPPHSNFTPQNSGLTLAAIYTPYDRYLHMMGPLCVSLGVIFMASLGPFVYAPTAALDARLYALQVYGGLILFCAALLILIQRMVRIAEGHPDPLPVSDDPVAFDPILM
jgi:growth hormone-inducible transmembrane protein